MRTKTKKKLIVTNSLLLAFLILGTVFAWFSNNFRNYVAANEVQVVADGDLQLSIENTTDDSKWTNSLTLSNYEWFKRTTFTDITGSGNGVFARPTLKLLPGYASVDESGTWTEPKRTDISDNDENGSQKYDYVRFTLYMRSKTKMSVQLGSGSFVKPSSMSDDLSALVGDSAPNKSRLGDFSKDLVAGAVRVSVTDSNDILKYTWIPRPEINANAETDQITTDSLVVNATSGGSYIHSYYAKDSSGTYSKCQLDSTKTVTGDIYTSQELVTLSDSTDDNGYHIGQVDFCIWLEGCDNEARRAFVDGKFKVFLNIVAVT